MFVSHSGGGSCTNKWKLVDVANNSQRGSNERVKEKIEKIKWFARKAARRDAVAAGVSPEDGDEVQRLKEALQETQAAILREREKAEVSTNIQWQIRGGGGGGGGRATPPFQL